MNNPEGGACGLAGEECLPCKGGVPPLEGDELHELAAQLDDAWELVDEKKLKRTMKFPDFAQALAFVNRVGALAESVGHHPDIFLAWGKVRVTLWTHKIGGLSRADFVFAAKVDAELTA